jgi:hypothetical protein
MSLEFFVATDDEVVNINDFENLVNLTFRYDICASGAENFQDFKLLLKFFLQNEDYVPKELLKTVREKSENGSFSFEIYKLERNVIENVAQIDKAKLDNPDSIEFWQSRGYFSQGTWNCIFGFHNLCNYAVRDGKNLYLVEIIE